MSLAYRRSGRCFNGREEIVAFLTRKWARELEYRLIKELWSFDHNRIAVRFAYESHDASGQWWRSYGNEMWEFGDDGLMHRRHASINDLAIEETQRFYHWPLGRRPDDHPGLSVLKLTSRGGKKERHIKPEDSPDFGNIWTFCAVDADTKLVPTFRVGKRDAVTANAFVKDVASRMKNRVQISTDALKAYVNAVEGAFGADVDYGQIIKTYGTESVEGQRRYSQPDILSSEKKVIVGYPDVDLISTSYIERLNATTRLHMRRLTRLTLAFSKKRENFEAAVGLHFAYYNFVKRHNTIRCTPAMAGGVVGSFWSVGDLVEAAA